MGLQYNGNTISQSSKINQYPYYNNNKITGAVYYNGTAVWKKYTALDFTFSGGSITGYTGTASKVTLPTSYSTVTDMDGSIIYVEGTTTKVTSIGQNAFKNNSSITEVVWNTQIQYVGNSAFEGCINLSTISGSSPSMESIGSKAFAGTAFTSIPFIITNATVGTAAFATRTPWLFTGDGYMGEDKLLASSTSNFTTNGVTCIANIYGFKSKITMAQIGGDDTASLTCVCYFNVTASPRTSSFELERLTTSIGYSNAKTSTQPRIFNANALPRWSGVAVKTSGSNLSSWNDSYNDGEYKISDPPSPGVMYTASAYIAVTATCLTEHTLLTLANGSRKRADQITYKDLLLCYNFETGKQDYQYPLAITRGEIHDHFTRIHLENNLYIDICGHHDIYDPEAHLFRTYGDGHILSTGLKDYYILDDSGQTVRIKSIERIEKEVTAYCIVTSGTTTAYADTAMIGMSHMNHSRIGEDNKFTKAFETDKLLCYTYEEFRNQIYNEPEKDIVLGLNLHFVHYYNKNPIGLDRLMKPLKRRIPLPKYKNKNLYTLGFIDKELTEIQ